MRPRRQRRRERHQQRRWGLGSPFGVAASRSLGQARQSPPTQRESLPPSQHSSSGSCCVGAVEARDTCREPAPDSREERGPTPRSVSDRSDKPKAECFDNTVMSDYLDVASDVENMCVEEGEWIFF